VKSSVIIQREGGVTAGNCSHEGNFLWGAQLNVDSSTWSEGVS